MSAVSAGSLSPIKSNQTGTIVMTGAGLTFTATVAAVNTAKALLVLLGVESNNISITNDPMIVLTNATTITATIGVAFGAQSGTLSWQLLEFV